MHGLIRVRQFTISEGHYILQAPPAGGRVPRLSGSGEVLPGDRRTA